MVRSVEVPADLENSMNGIMEKDEVETIAVSQMCQRGVNLRFWR